MFGAGEGSNLESEDMRSHGEDGSVNWKMLGAGEGGNNNCESDNISPEGVGSVNWTKDSSREKDGSNLWTMAVCATVS